MTESEWQCCNEPGPILRYLEGKVSERKWRLLAAGCCRLVWHLLRDPRSRRAVEVAEHFADGLATYEQLVEAARDAHQAAQAQARAEARAATVAAHVPMLFPGVREVVWALVRSRVEDVSTQVPEREAAEKVAEREVTLLLRDIVGNPFRPVVLSPDWLTWSNGTVRRLAESVYTDRAFELMPILADALEDAGCHDETILSHLRGPGPHVRGCFVLDLLLGKE